MNLEVTKKLITGIFHSEIKNLKKIQEGQDGEKFYFEDIKGDKYFCKIKDSKTSQELPFQEQEILEKVESKYIIKPIITDVYKNNYFFIRKYIDGPSLEEVIANKGALEEKDVRKLAFDLIESVDALSNVGAVHFDIKPANIVCGSDNNYYLIDFGAAKFIKKIKDERIHPARKYIAPELLSYLFNPEQELALRRLNTMTDMYGIGAVLYSALTGKRISDFYKTSSDILNTTVPPVKSILQDVNPKLAEFIDRSLSKSPSKRIRPSDAKEFLEGKEIPRKIKATYLLRTTESSGSEHTGMLSSISEVGTKTGIYWISEKDPYFKKISISNLFWELPFIENEVEIAKNLSKQQHHDVSALIISGIELENPPDDDIVAKNLSAIDISIQWKNNNAPHLPLMVVINIDEALLTSSSMDKIRDIYASRDVDGIVLRVYTPDRMSFDVRHLHSIKRFIEPWKNKIVFFDGDLSVFPLSLFGVDTLISTTFPRLQILPKRRQKPKFAQKPDGVYSANFLSLIKRDSLLGLRLNKFSKALTDCGCPSCVNTLMKKGSPKWERPDRRKHFIYSIPYEIDSIKTSGTIKFIERIKRAQQETVRYGKPYNIDTPNLRVWFDFLN